MLYLWVLNEANSKGLKDIVIFGRVKGISVNLRIKRDIERLKLRWFEGDIVE